MPSKKDLKSFTEICKKIKNPKQGLPEPVFEALCKLVVFPATEVVIINDRREILLTFRNDKWWKGWHVPGGLLRFGETFEQRLKQVVKNELGAELKSFKFLFVENYKLEKRGHTMGNFFLCELKGKPKVGQFFKTPPKDTIDQHRKVWKKLKSAIKTLK
jgi:colanic acid biosynthesis protein WcaH